MLAGIKSWPSGGRALLRRTFRSEWKSATFLSKSPMPDPVPIPHLILTVGLFQARARRDGLFLQSIETLLELAIYTYLPLLGVHRVASSVSSVALGSLAWCVVSGQKIMGFHSRLEQCIKVLSIQVPRDLLLSGVKRR